MRRVRGRAGCAHGWRRPTMRPSMLLLPAAHSVRGSVARGARTVWGPGCARRGCAWHPHVRARRLLTDVFAWSSMREQGREELVGLHHTFVEGRHNICPGFRFFRLGGQTWQRPFALAPRPAALHERRDAQASRARRIFSRGRAALASAVVLRAPVRAYRSGGAPSKLLVWTKLTSGERKQPRYWGVTPRC